MSTYITNTTDLTSVANAIRTKGGTSASLTYPTGFVNAINAIPSGGGDTPPDPANDGKVHLYISIPDGTESAKRVFAVQFTQSAANGVTVDWGDGSAAETYTGTSSSQRTHVYTDCGDYHITLTKSTGVTLTFATYIYGGSTTQCGFSKIYLKYAYLYGMDSATGSIFQYCSNLKKVVCPTAATLSGQSAFAYCTSLKSVTLPNITTLPAYTFNYCVSLETVTLPNITSGGTSIFSQCFSLKTITLPSSLTEIPNYFLQYCFSLQSVTIPSTVTSIGNSAFAQAPSCKEYHVLPATPPTLGTTPFSNISTGTKIYVPSASLANYQTAWSSYATYLVGE